MALHKVLHVGGLGRGDSEEEEQGFEELGFVYCSHWHVVSS